MKNLYNCLANIKTVQEVSCAFYDKNNKTQIYGANENVRRFFIALSLCSEKKNNVFVVILSNMEKAIAWLNESSYLLPSMPAFILPPDDLFGSNAISVRGLELKEKRLLVGTQMTRNIPAIVFTTAEAMAQKVLPLSKMMSRALTLVQGQQLSVQALIKEIIGFGYERVEQVDAIGYFSVRGGIIDIFPINEKHPLRIEFFDDEIDSLRSFDIITQRTIKMQEICEIMPLHVNGVSEKDNDKNREFVLSGFSANITIVVDDPARIQEEIKKFPKENPKYKPLFFSWEECVTNFNQYNTVYFSALLKQVPFAKPSSVIGLAIQELSSYYKQKEMLLDDLHRWIKRGFIICGLLSDEEKIAHWYTVLREEGLPVQTVAGKTVDAGCVNLFCGTCEQGIELLKEKVIILGEKDFSGKRYEKKKTVKTDENAKKLPVLDLRVGDYVVHTNYGIGRYMGVETIFIEDVHKDYFYIRYAGEDKLYVPTESVHLLQRYSAGEGVTPRLNKISSNEWHKAKSKVGKAIKDIANKLIEIYAKRKMAQGIAFDADTEWQKDFEESFPYQETADQLQAISDVKIDMEKKQPMDRLVCGDVGFGKTEVAMRAAFKAVMSGKQVAILAPTTILVQQHYQNFSTRCHSFGLRVAMVSRFVRPAEQKEILKKLAVGDVDILVGTHRLLQKDIKFKDLGLLVVDEEQRFGVEQKEKIKEICNNIDILTLSATPIPRTLHMALTNTRDLSIIETPPEERLPVQAYVAEENDELIIEAVMREINRGGQVFIVHNRVENIDKVKDYLEALMPNVRIITGHGQMDERLLEQVMVDFYEQRFDVLLCTTIIENGLDMPNVNTIIVFDADKMGLSQLYQIKGRVGRSRRLAYAYFLYKHNKVLSETAEKRLHALQNFTELGAGLKIAMRDMEIRGAGNILGAEQHGYIISVGFEMYCTMLEEAIKELKSTGESYLVDLDIEFNISVDAYLPDEYVNESMHKIELYKKIALIRNEEGLTELLDELIDRFGEPPPSVMALLEVVRCKNMMRQLGIRKIAEISGRVELYFGDRPNILPDKIMQLDKNIAMPVRFVQKESKIVVRMISAKEKLFAVVKKILSNLL